MAKFEQLLAERLREQGVTLADDELTELSEACETLMAWSQALESLVSPETLPIFIHPEDSL